MSKYVENEEKVESAETLYRFRRTGSAYTAMKQEIQDFGKSAKTEKTVATFNAIRHDYRIVELFKEKVLQRESWSRLYKHSDPYDGIVVRDVDSFRQTLPLTNSVYIRAIISAPIKHAICLMWAVEFMPKWCPQVTKTIILEEIDDMSRYVMIYLNPGIVSLYGTLVAFLKISIIEIHDESALHVGISIENMTSSQTEPFIELANKRRIVHVKNIIICARPMNHDLTFEICVLYVRNTERNILSYMHDYLWLHFVMPSVWHLGFTCIKSAMLDRNSVCLHNWMEDNDAFCCELNKKLIRASSSYNNTVSSPPQKDNSICNPPRKDNTTGKPRIPLLNTQKKHSSNFDIQMTPVAEALETPSISLFSSSLPIKDLIEF